MLVCLLFFYSCLLLLIKQVEATIAIDESKTRTTYRKCPPLQNKKVLPDHKFTNRTLADYYSKLDPKFKEDIDSLQRRNASETGSLKMLEIGCGLGKDNLLFINSASALI